MNEWDLFLNSAYSQNTKLHYFKTLCELLKLARLLIPE